MSQRLERAIKCMQDTLCQKLDQLIDPCEYTELTIPFCATEDTEHTFEDIEALVNASSERYHTDYSFIDLNQDDQSIHSIAVNSYHCDSVIKNKYTDDQPFTVVSDQACVKNSLGQVVFQLFGGGSMSIDKDNNVYWPCLSAGFYCVTVKRCPVED